MILYNKNDYQEGREKVNGDLVFQLFQEALKKNDIITDEKVCKHVIMNFLTELAFQLYLYPERYLDLGKFVIYRSENLHNLLTVQAKDGENAVSAREYIRRGGLYSEELTEVVGNFVKELSVTALEEQQKAADKVNELNELSSKVQKRSKKRT